MSSPKMERRSFPEFICFIASDDKQALQSDISQYRIKGSYKFGDIIKLKGINNNLYIVVSGVYNMNEIPTAEVSELLGNSIIGAKYILSLLGFPGLPKMEQMPCNATFVGQVHAEGPKLWEQYGTLTIPLSFPNISPDFGVDVYISKHNRDIKPSLFDTSVVAGDWIMVTGHLKFVKSQERINGQNLIKYLTEEEKTKISLFLTEIDNLKKLNFPIEKPVPQTSDLPVLEQSSVPEVPNIISDESILDENITDKTLQQSVQDEQQIKLEKKVLSDLQEKFKDKRELQISRVIAAVLLSLPMKENLHFDILLEKVEGLINGQIDFSSKDQKDLTLFQTVITKMYNYSLIYTPEKDDEQLPQSVPLSIENSIHFYYRWL